MSSRMEKSEKDILPRRSEGMLFNRFFYNVQLKLKSFSYWGCEYSHQPKWNTRKMEVNYISPP